jgi:hypothetical protein
LRNGLLGGASVGRGGHRDDERIQVAAGDDHVLSLALDASDVAPAISLRVVEYVSSISVA